MRYSIFFSLFLLLLSGLFAYDYDSGIIDVRTSPLASGGERRFLPSFISVCIDQPPLVVDLQLPPGKYTVDAYLRYMPCDQEHETMDIIIGSHTEHIPDMGCYPFLWYYNLGECGSGCGGDPAPYNFYNTVDGASLMFVGTGLPTEGVNIIYVRVRGIFFVNHPPEITALTPNEGAFSDDIEIFATVEDIDGFVHSVQYEYSLDGETWIPIETTIDPDSPIYWTSGLDECEVWLRAKAYDGEYYSDWFVEGPILIDNTPPVTTDDAPEGWVNHDVIVNLVADDGVCGSGFDVDATQYSINGDDLVFGNEIFLEETGIYTIEYFSTDIVGNVEDIKTTTVMIDNDCPIFADWSVPAIDEDYVGALPISVTVTDEHSGLLDYTLYFAFGDTEIPDETAIVWEAFEDAIDADWSAHREQYLYVKAIAEDIAGNVCDSEIQVEFVDPVNRPPIVTSLIPNEGYFKDDITVLAEAEDPDGPVLSIEYEYSTDGDVWIPLDIVYEIENPVIWASGLDECEVWLRARAFDGELYSEWFVEGPILIDNTPPITTDDAPEGWVNYDVTVTLYADDGICGVGFDGEGFTTYSINDGDFVVGNSFDLTENGVYTIYYYSADDLGHIEDMKTTTVMIDKVCPIFSDWSVPEIDEDYIGALPVSVTVTDEHSGLLEYTLYYAFGDTEIPDEATIVWEAFEDAIDADWSAHREQYLYVKAIAEDIAGNVCDSEIQVEFVDPVNRPPYITALIPDEGKFKDDISVLAHAEDPDGPVLSIEYQYSVDGEVWIDLAIITDIETPVIWISELDECEVWLRAIAFDGELYSDWFVSGPILIDNTPPVTVDDAPEGWMQEDVIVTLTADDGVCGSGFEDFGGTYYSIDGAPFVEGNEIAFTESGVYNVVYYSDDDVGNVEDANSFELHIDKECVVFTDWVIPDLSSSSGDITCINYTGRFGIEYTVEVGTDPTCGLTGIKFEEGYPGLGEDGAVEADILQFKIPSSELSSTVEVSTKAGTVCGYTAFNLDDCLSAIAVGDICQQGPDEGGFIIQLIDIEDMGDGNHLLTWRLISDDDSSTPALSNVTFGIMPADAPFAYTTIGDYEICFGGGIAECDTYEGRGGIEYVVEMGYDPTCGLSGIKFEGGYPGLGEDGAVEADIFQFTIPMGTLPTTIEVSTKAGRFCGYTVFTTADCGVLTGDGGFCEGEPDEGGFIVQLLAIEPIGDSYLITFRVISDDDNRTPALSNITFGFPDVDPMTSYTTPSEVVICTEGSGPSCEGFAVTVSDAVSGVSEASLSYAFSPSSYISEPSELMWTIMDERFSDGILSGELCENWNEYAGLYLHVLAEGSDIAGNECYEIMTEYIDDVVVIPPTYSHCGPSFEMEFPAVSRSLHAIGYNVYLADKPDGIYRKLNDEPIIAGVFRDEPRPGQWFYKATRVTQTLEETPFGDIYEIIAYDIVASDLSAELLPNSNVKLTWTSVPEAVEYQIFTGRDEIDYRSPVATITGETQWVSRDGMFREGHIYGFDLKVITTCDCDREVRSTKLYISPKDDPFIHGGRMSRITSPAPGAVVAGNFITISAEQFIPGYSDVPRLYFQMRQAGHYNWNNIEPSDVYPDAYTPNPDMRKPFFINFDASDMPPGEYEIRASRRPAYLTSEFSDYYHNFTITRSSEGLTENAQYENHWMTFIAPPDRLMPAFIGDGRNNTLLQTQLSHLASGPVEFKVSIVHADNLPPSDFRSMIAWRFDKLTGPKADGFSAKLKVHYDNATLTELSLDESSLYLYHYYHGRWHRLSSITDTDLNFIMAEVGYLGLYAIGSDRILTVAEESILPLVNELIFSYPNPFNAEVTIHTNITNPNTKLAVYSVLGEEIRVLNTDRRTGSIRTTWDGRDSYGSDMPSGIYLVNVKNDTLNHTHRIILIR